MKNILVLLGFLLITSCAKEKELDPFQVQKQNIGLLTDSTKVKELPNAFPLDSISTYIGGDEFTGNINNIEVYSKTGEKLLELTPHEALDSTSTIKSIRIIDDRFKTLKGLGKNSTFKDIQDKYKISSIQNTLNNVIVSVDEINAYFTIDKKHLPAAMRYDMSIKIDAVQIPDNTPIKDFYIQWY